MNRIQIDLDDVELLVQVECTSLQLMRQPIVLHAKGFFVVEHFDKGTFFDMDIYFPWSCIDTVSSSFTAAEWHHNIYGFFHPIRTKTLYKP